VASAIKAGPGAARPAAQKKGSGKGGLAPVGQACYTPKEQLFKMTLILNELKTVSKV